MLKVASISGTVKVWLTTVGRYLSIRPCYTYSQSIGLNTMAGARVDLHGAILCGP